MMHLRIAALAMLIAGAAASPATAQGTASTQLVKCGEQSCLLVTGRRADASAPVSLNGHAVAVQGAHKWRVRVPVSTVRAWSQPNARKISVAVDGAAQDTSLPIGMLGHDQSLAMLVVRVK